MSHGTEAWIFVFVFAFMNFASISAPPTTEPEISGIHPVVSVGDMITGNCTSYHTKPAASLMFYINDEKVRKKNSFLLSVKDHFLVL